MHDVFETLTDDKRRCEYDKAHRIKGKWPTYTCRYAFRGEYRPIAQEIREKWMEVLKNEKKGTSGNEEGDKQESPDLESEPASPPLKVKPPKPKAGKPSGRKSDSHKASRLRSENKRPTRPGTQARPEVTVITVEVEPEAKGAVATVTSAVAQVGGGVVELSAWVWTRVVRHTWEVATLVGTAIGVGAYCYGRLIGG